MAELKTVVLSPWETIVEGRKMFLSFAVALGLAAIACALGMLLGFDELRWPSVILSLLVSHATTAWLALGRIANLQAALDMLRTAKTGKLPE